LIFRTRRLEKGRRVLFFRRRYCAPFLHRCSCTAVPAPLLLHRCYCTTDPARQRIAA
jgi:hypothetical protein